MNSILIIFFIIFIFILTCLSPLIGIGQDLFLFIFAFTMTSVQNLATS